ncbi:MAG: hypothetical protein OXU51_10600 [Candidatus Poribacteria bacterium]|nr:hypothetical protein [Candidatus Poribacteria bacterium]
MKKQFYFSVMICVLLSAFLLSVEATDISNETQLWQYQNRKYNLATQKAIKAVEARSLMGEMAVYYNLNAQDINKGKSVLLGSVLKGAGTVTVTYISGGSTLSATIISSMEPALKSLGLVGSINVKSEVESAYESAISALSSQITYTSGAIARYQSAHNSYSLVLSSHNSQHHGSPDTYRYAHTIDPITEVTLNTGLPSFSCPGGGCSTRWTMPSHARTTHFVRCGRYPDPYGTRIQGCNQVYYTCNTSENSRHKTTDCGLNKWIETMQGWTETACPGDYRKCMPGRITREHSTILTGVNVTSTCGGNRPAAPPSAGNPPSESPVVSPPPTPTPTPPLSPTYHACGEHETSVSGDHSLQASCSSTDSNGNSCTVTNFYACGSHTHSYPAPPPTPTPPPEPTPTPPPPTTVACGARGWTGCTASVSSSTEHRVPSCSGCGSTYWTCSTFASNHTTLKTCRYSECGQTWQKCASAPVCNKPYRKQNGLKCWAQ